MENKSSPKSFGKSRVATSHSRKWTRMLWLLLSVQFPPQTSPITQPPVHYIHIIQIQDDGIYCPSIASRDKNTPISNLPDLYSKRSSSMSYHLSATKIICEELHSHPSHTEWTRPLVCYAMLTAMSPISQP